MKKLNNIFMVGAVCSVVLIPSVQAGVICYERDSSFYCSNPSSIPIAVAPVAPVAASSVAGLSTGAGFAALGLAAGAVMLLSKDTCCPTCPTGTTGTTGPTGTTGTQ